MSQPSWAAWIEIFLVIKKAPASAVAAHSGCVD